MNVFLEVRATLYDNLTPFRLELFDGFSNSVDSMGTGALWNDGVRNHRIWEVDLSPLDLCVLGATGAQIGNIEETRADEMFGKRNGMRGRVTRGFLLGFLMAAGALVFPDQVPDGQTGNRGQELLTANGAPVGIKVYTLNPADRGYTPVGA